MNPLTLSAQFAAYTWFVECHGGKAITQEEATKFARENWHAFLEHAHEGLGRLLMRIGRLESSKPAGMLPYQENELELVLEN